MSALFNLKDEWSIESVKGVYGGKGVVARISGKKLVTCNTYIHNTLFLPDGSSTRVVLEYSPSTLKQAIRRQAGLRHVALAGPCSVGWASGMEQGATACGLGPSRIARRTGGPRGSRPGRLPVETGSGKRPGLRRETSMTMLAACVQGDGPPSGEARRVVYRDASPDPAWW